MDQNENFTTDDAIKVAEAMQSAVGATLAQFDDEYVELICQKMLNLVMTTKPYLWVTVEGLEELVRQVFKDPEFTDFILMLQFNFMMRWGEGQQKFIGLCNSVSWAMGAYEDPSSKTLATVAIPDELRIRLSARASTSMILKENPWLVCLAVLRSYVSKDAFSPAGSARSVPGIQDPVRK